MYDEAFDAFANRADLPEFDFIGLHGIWSWISEDNRHVIVDFIRRKFKVGGVLYISYNTLPGWAAFAPMRHLMTEHADVLGSEGRGIVSRIEGAINFAEKLLATNPLFARANPLVGDRIAKLKNQSRHYLAHEYFNRDWHPMHFATFSGWLQEAKVSYACSANYQDHVDVINLSTEQQTFLSEIPDAGLRESVRDFMVNQQFRKDYWVKGARTLSALDAAEHLREQRIVLSTHRQDVPLTVSGSLGEAQLNESVYTPILDLMADHKVRSLAQMEKAMVAQGISFAQLLQAVMLMVGAGHFVAAQEEQVINKARKTCDKINAHIMHKSRGSNEVSYLASPVTGGGVTVNRFQQLFLLALRQGLKEPAQWAAFVWDILNQQSQKLVKGGETIESEEGNLAELGAQAAEFQVKVLPVLKALQIA